jgi:tetratricopeptide (TPR) repeat protein
MRRAANICSTALALLLLSAAPAHAGSPPNAEAGKAAALPHAKRGLELFDAGQYAEAIAEFERAEKLFHAPTHLKFMAEAHEKLGQLLEAQRRYGEAIADQLPEDAPEAFRRVQTEARKQLTDLVQRIPTLTLEVQGPEREQVQVTANGESWPGFWQRPRRFNPGEQEIVVRAEGFDSATRTVTLAEGQAEQLVIQLSPLSEEPAPEEPGLTPYVPAIVAFGVGGAGLLVPSPAA